MKNKIFLIVIILISLVSNIFPQQTFRRVILLSRSVGNHIWDHEGATTSVPEEITSYNTAHSYTGADAVSMEKVYPFPVVTDNEWHNWHSAFDNGDVDVYMNNPDYDIIVIKTCFYSSDMYGGVGQPSDTISNPSNRTIYNYKWHWRSIIHIMEAHPNNFFVIWTNAPQVEAETSPQQAAYSHWFCTWANDTLAAGIDATYGTFPSNVYVFDYFHKLVNENYYERPEYADGPNDAHPNAAASDLIAPQFVQEVFDAAINYPLPVELSAFSATIIGSSIQLNWRTETEVNNYGFEVERKINNWEKIGFVHGNGNSNSPKNYSFIDKNITNEKYFYRLK